MNDQKLEPPYKIFLNYLKQNSFALWISLVYVSLGGIVSCSLYPTDPLNGSWWFWGWIVTLPVNLISFAFRYTDDISYSSVIIIQAIMFIPTFKLFSLIVKKLRK